jgi:hypothetical protein
VLRGIFQLTMMIYAHVLKIGGPSVRRPLNAWQIHPVSRM